MKKFNNKFQSTLIVASVLCCLFGAGQSCPASDGAVKLSVPVLPKTSDNVVWNSPSNDARGSMPLGNGDVGVNAWVEPSGDLIFYISKTDAWDENGRLCKIGRVRVKFKPALVIGNGFRQELKLAEGRIEIDTGNGVHIGLWIDAHRPVVRLQAESSTPVECRAEVELWRLRERPFGNETDSFSGRELSASELKPTVLPDVVVSSTTPGVVWYHRNTRSLYDLGLKVQHLEALKGRFIDPLLNRTFGTSLRGDGFVSDGQKTIVSSKPATQHVLSAVVLSDRFDTPDAWLAQLSCLEKAVSSVDIAEARRAHESWWRDFWSRGWVLIDGTPEAKTVGRGYMLQRFMNACSGRGGSPIKFNGSIFTVEAKPGASPETPDGDPDWRRWGSNYWFQNTRLAYWPMLAAGDFDMMDPWFHMYREALPLGKARVKTYYGFDNAAVFPETMYFWGLPNNGDYGWKNNAPEPASSYIRRYWNGSLELTTMMLDRYDFTQDREFARRVLVPLADPLIAFFDQYWKRDNNGKIRFDPAQSLETWHVAVNPLPEIAGLRFLLPRLLALPQDTTTAEQRTSWKRFLGELPPVPIGMVNNQRVLRPAESFSAKSNIENPELYAVFPFRLYGVGRPDLDLARATYNLRGNRLNRGWCQDSIQAACLGLGDEAGRLVAARAAQPLESNYRFPAMWGPNMDWIPDQDHGNNILNTVQRMVLQSDGRRLFLLPAWPKDWNAKFKLHAPYQTTVEGIVKDGKLVNLKVTPESRRTDIVLSEEK